MADNDEFQTSRLTNASAGSSIDDALANVEAAIRNLFGIPADTAMSEAMSIAAAGNVTMTGTLTLAGAPTTDNMAATKKYVDDNASGAAAVRCNVRLSSDQTISASSTEYIEFDVAPIEEGGNIWDAGNPTRITIPETGDYMIGGVIELGGGTTVWADVIIRKNGSTTLHTKAVTLNEQATNVSGSFATMISLTAADYIEIGITNRDASQTADVVSGTAGSRFWIMKVG